MNEKCIKCLSGTYLRKPIYSYKLKHMILFFFRVTADVHIKKNETKHIPRRRQLKRKGIKRLHEKNHLYEFLSHER